jgi:ComF family protein
VPVPLARARERERGFNQAEELARGLGLPVAHLLRRVRSTQPQVDLSADARKSNVRDAFICNGGAIAAPMRVIVLVDDVTTTGATLDACARALLDGGCREVVALTYTRTL